MKNSGKHLVLHGHVRKRKRGAEAPTPLDTEYIRRGRQTLILTVNGRTNIRAMVIDILVPRTPEGAGTDAVPALARALGPALGMLLEKTTDAIDGIHAIEVLLISRKDIEGVAVPEDLGITGERKVIPLGGLKSILWIVVDLNPIICLCRRQPWRQRLARQIKATCCTFP